MRLVAVARVVAAAAAVLALLDAEDQEPRLDLRGCRTTMSSPESNKHRWVIGLPVRKENEVVVPTINPSVPRMHRGRVTTC
mgnify:CR=1 FL=1|tara:strand:- start:435 stop:677 length:243 start_codon:yes stop_codon:yes gene_type:complete